jgi:hypothetical protein
VSERWAISSADEFAVVLVHDGDATGRWDGLVDPTELWRTFDAD